MAPDQARGLENNLRSRRRTQPLGAIQVSALSEDTSTRFGVLAFEKRQREQNDELRYSEAVLPAPPQRTSFVDY